MRTNWFFYEHKLHDLFSQLHGLYLKYSKIKVHKNGLFRALPCRAFQKLSSQSTH
jgi:hypothetical protein